MSDSDDVIILPPAGAPRSRRPWWSLLVIGAVLVAIGVGMLIWPFSAASWMLALLVGLGFVTSGAGFLTAGRTGSTVAGVVFILIGVLAIVFSGFTATVVVTALAVVFALIGVATLVFAASVKSAYAAVIGIVVLGVSIAALIWPDAALIVFSIGLGLLAIAVGAWLVVLSFRLRRSGFTITTLRS